MDSHLRRLRRPVVLVIGVRYGPAGTYCAHRYGEQGGPSAVSRFGEAWGRTPVPRY